MTAPPRNVTSGAPLVGTGFERLVVGTAIAGTTFGSVPAAGADAVIMQVEGTAVRLRMDGGTPTTTIGMNLNITDIYRFDRTGTLTDYHFISAGTVPGTVQAQYFEVR